MVINDPAVVAEVEAAFRRYDAALLANDTAHLDEVFWESDRTVRFGATENCFGKDEIRAFRAVRTAMPEPRHFENLTITAFGDEVASVNTLMIKPSSVGTVTRWSQVWLKVDGRWRIASAHVSTIKV